MARASTIILTLVLLAGCRGHGASRSAAPPQSTAPAAAAQPTLTPEELGALGADIRKHPADAHRLIAARGLTDESFEQAIRKVSEDPAAALPAASMLLSSARTTVVPTAITRPPAAFAPRTSSAVRSGTSYHSSAGRSCSSRLATPVCRTSLPSRTPECRRQASMARVNARPADAISAEPSLCA